MAAVLKAVGTVPVVGEEMRKARKREAGFNKLCRKGVLQTVAVMLEWKQTTRRQWIKMSWRWAQTAERGSNSGGKLSQDLLLCLCVAQSNICGQTSLTMMSSFQTMLWFSCSRARINSLSQPPPHTWPEKLSDAERGFPIALWADELCS